MWLGWKFSENMEESEGTTQPAFCHYMLNQENYKAIFIVSQSQNLDRPSDKNTDKPPKTAKIYSCAWKAPCMSLGQ